MKKIEIIAGIFIVLATILVLNTCSDRTTLPVDETEQRENVLE